MATQLVNSFNCRMWEMHDRLGEEVTVQSSASLIESFRKHGQKQAVLGRKLSGDPNYEVELIYGARRLFAARHLGMQILVDVRDGLDDRAALVEMDIENRVRKDISPYERGMSYKRWLREGHFNSQSEIAKCLGISEAQISRVLRFADLPTAVVQAFESPQDIREEWAVTLAKNCADPEIRSCIVRRARAVAASSRPRSPQQIYDDLFADRATSVQRRVIDQIIRNSAGTAVLRVGIRAKTIHLILPRTSLDSTTLGQITSRIAEMFNPKLGADSLHREDQGIERARHGGPPDVAQEPS